MNWIPGIFRRRQLYDDLSEEMRLHIEERMEQLMSEGLSPEEAERQARIAFGNVDADRGAQPRSVAVANAGVDLGRRAIRGCASCAGLRDSRSPPC